MNLEDNWKLYFFLEIWIMYFLVEIENESFNIVPFT